MRRELFFNEIAREAGVTVHCIAVIWKALHEIVAHALYLNGTMRLPGIANIMVKTTKAKKARMKHVFGQLKLIGSQNPKARLKFAASKKLKYMVGTTCITIAHLYY